MSYIRDHRTANIWEASTTWAHIIVWCVGIKWAKGNEYTMMSARGTATHDADFEKGTWRVVSGRNFKTNLKAT
jgi:hypothetical protein